jgi:hypothetical protein
MFNHQANYYADHLLITIFFKIDCLPKNIYPVKNIDINNLIGGLSLQSYHVGFLEALFN